MECIMIVLVESESSEYQGESDCDSDEEGEDMDSQDTEQNVQGNNQQSMLRILLKINLYHCQLEVYLAVVN